jgi:2-amino-4-hydroxy-6-hydroxymethyldihydropteridine diphosphokinase
MTALLSLGSNLDPETHLASAARALRQRFPGVRFSPVYRVPAIGFDGPDFLNAGALIESDLAPLELDAWLHALEDAHGRRRDVPRFSSRTLDIDLVLFDGLVLRGPGHLELPRPELKHAFVLKPFVDIAPDFIEPVSGLTLAQLWKTRSEPMHAVSFGL